MNDTREKGDDAGQQGSNEPSAKDKADLYVALGKSAQERFNVHHGVEWKIHFGLWTLFVAGAVLLTRYDSEWALTAPACIFLNVFAVVLLVVYCCWWLPHSHNYREECTRTRWWWEACALKELGRKPPPELRPDGWPIPSDGDTNEWGNRGWIHVSQKMFVVVTICFALLFVSALWIKFKESARCEESVLTGSLAALAAGFIGGLLGGVITSGWVYDTAYRHCREKFRKSEEHHESSGV